LGTCSTAGQATNDNIIRRMPFAFWVAKATNTRSEYVTNFAFFYSKNRHTNAPQYCAIPVLLTRKEELKLTQDLYVKEKLMFKYNFNSAIFFKELLNVFLLILGLLSSIVFFSPPDFST
jgi:hypothetical protein